MNSSYNIYVLELIVQHLDANLGLYVDGKLKAGERRVLTTKWVDTRRWKRVKKEKDLIKHSFRKCGLSNNLDGGEDALMNIKSIDGYKIPLAKKEFQMIEETDSEDDDDDSDDDDDDDDDNEFEELSSESDSDSE